MLFFIIGHIIKNKFIINKFYNPNSTGIHLSTVSLTVEIMVRLSFLETKQNFDNFIFLCQNFTKIHNLVKFSSLKNSIINTAV